MTLADLDRTVRATGPGLLPLLALASLVEYVFPPFPGDTIVLVGAALAVRGQVSVAAVFAVCTAGSAAGAVADYLAGGWLGGRLARPSAARWRRLLPPDRLARVEGQYRRYGPWLILANRFVPAARALFFVFAGMSELGLMKTVALGAVSAMAWNGLIVGAGYALGANLPRLDAWLKAFDRTSLEVVGAVGLGIVVVLGLRRWRGHARARVGRGAKDESDSAHR